MINGIDGLIRERKRIKFARLRLNRNAYASFRVDSHGGDTE